MRGEGPLEVYPSGSKCSATACCSLLLHASGPNGVGHLPGLKGSLCYLALSPSLGVIQDAMNYQLPLSRVLGPPAKRLQNGQVGWATGDLEGSRRV